MSVSKSRPGLCSFLSWCLVLCLLTAGASAQTPANDALEKRIEVLEKELQDLKRQVQAEKDALPPASSAPALITAGVDGFALRSADTNFLLHLRATIQADGRFYPGDEPGTDTFLMRRVRPILEGTVFERFDYRLMLDFGSGLNSTASNVGFVQEAFVTARLWPEFQIQAGKFKAPVGLERLKADADTVFVERNYPTLLVPNRDVGVQVQGDIRDGLLTYQAGIFNGVFDGGSDDVESDDGDKEFAGRIFARPFAHADTGPLRGIGFGLAGTIGQQKGAVPSFVTPGQQRFFSYRSGAGTNATTSNVTADGEHWRLAPQAYYYWGPFGLLGEYVISDQVLRSMAGRVPTFLSAQNTAWQLTASYLLTGGNNRFGPILPVHPVSFQGGGGWGTWELAAQVGRLRIDPDVYPLFADPSTAPREATSWGVGLNWYPNANLKLMLNYERTDLTGGKSSRLGALGEDVILTRIQLVF